MNNLHEILAKNFSSIPIDPFWNTGNEQEHKMHRIHTYPAKFPSFITTKAIEYSKNKGISVQIMGDLFCGCGTTAYEANRNNIDYWGCDINPVATLIAKTKSQKYQDWRLKRYLEDILDACKATLVLNQYDQANDRLKYWFKEKEYNQLFNLKRAIELNTSKNSIYRRFFLCAFSNILKSTSVWLTKSIKPQVDPNKKPADVIESFIKQCNFMIQANEESALKNSSTMTIKTCNVLDENVEIPEFDLIVTSPPYVTSYEYADLHQLSSLWLGFVEDYRDLRDGSIGSRYHEPKLSHQSGRLNITGQEIVGQLKNKRNHRTKSVEKYFFDMQEVAKKSYNILNKNGMALFVIANTVYQSVLIDNAKHLSESLINVGFSEITISKRKISNKALTPYRDRNGRFTSNANGRLVYSEEFIIIGRK